MITPLGYSGGVHSTMDDVSDWCLTSTDPTYPGTKIMIIINSNDNSNNRLIVTYDVDNLILLASTK